ncbi:MAG: aldo/keto reductase, partial [Candidatus Tectomicrobia bacterium]|nr:aldo/keto reductase [Candidatus Tectomicrobia bacterium]
MMTTPLFLPRRVLGRTDFLATLLGIGDVADRQLPLTQLVATIRRALDAGLNLIDTAPGYEQGYSEQIVGEALKGRRDGVFVIDKIDHLAQPVAPQIDASLARLHLDDVDLFVFHNVSTLDAWTQLSAPEGGMAQLAQAVRVGKTRFKGISSHSPDVLAAAIPSGLLDVVMFPVGPYVDVRYVEDMLPLARQYDVGTVCFKTFGAG